MDSVAGLFLSTNNADEEKMFRNQYYQIPHPHKERTSMLKACIFPKRLTKWGGIFKSINCEFLSCK